MQLIVQPRDAKAKAKYLRRADRVPGVLYGHEVENQPVECREQELHKVFVHAGESTIIDLNVGGKTVPVLIHDIAFDPVTGRYEHVDFFAPDMSKEVTANIPVRITGEAPGVKDLGGVLVRNRDTLEVKCLPKDLPHDIEVSIATLAHFHDAVIVSQVRVPTGVTVLSHPDEIIVSVQPPRKEEETKPAAAVVEGEAPAEGEEGEKKEGEEGKEDGKGGESAEKDEEGKEKRK